MYQQFLANSDLLQWPLLALGIFFTVFVVVLGHVLIGTRHRKPQLERMAATPLDDDEEPSLDGRVVRRYSGRLARRQAGRASGEGGAA